MLVGTSYLTPREISTIPGAAPGTPRVACDTMAPWADKKYRQREASPGDAAVER